MGPEDRRTFWTQKHGENAVCGRGRDGRDAARAGSLRMPATPGRQGTGTELTPRKAYKVNQAC